MSGAIILIYVLTAICFILALKGLSSPTTARQGNIVAIAGMALAIITTLFYIGRIRLPELRPDATIYVLIAICVLLGGGVGTLIALRVRMKSIPQLVAAFHSLVGLAAVLIAASAFYAPQSYGIGTPGDIRLASLIEMSLGSAIGAITFTGSVVAFAKLQGLVGGAPVVFKGQHLLNLLIGVVVIALIVSFSMNAAPQALAFWAMTGLSFVIGVTLIIPIGGADMPVVISMLNSYSGWAAAGIGFTLNNPLLIITGALVGSSGAILSYIMCRAMNRSFFNVILGGFGTGEGATADSASRGKGAKAGSAEDAAFIMKNAQSVIIVPGYGMAVAQAQHAVRELYDLLSKEGVNVRFAIHPVAGRMPGHMNVLLAEANIPYDVVFELEEINSDFASCDVAYVIGANDVTNPAAKVPGSPIFGMPILEVEKARTVFFIKRSLSPGYAGIDNRLFYADNTMMLFADAKKMTEEIVRALH
jgi:NAD(P) transhydrogenase subunit beta